MRTVVTATPSTTALPRSGTKLGWTCRSLVNIDGASAWSTAFDGRYVMEEVGTGMAYFSNEVG